MSCTRNIPRPTHSPSAFCPAVMGHSTVVSGYMLRTERLHWRHIHGGMSACRPSSAYNGYSPRCGTRVGCLSFRHDGAGRSLTLARCLSHPPTTVGTETPALPHAHRSGRHVASSALGSPTPRVHEVELPRTRHIYAGGGRTCCSMQQMARQAVVHMALAARHAAVLIENGILRGIIAAGWQTREQTRLGPRGRQGYTEKCVSETIGVVGGQRSKFIEYETCYIKQVAGTPAAVRRTE